jgi:hypothetical protein
MRLAQYLRTVQTEVAADQAGQGPLLWSPLRLTRTGSNAEFHYRDDTAGVVEDGPLAIHRRGLQEGRTCPYHGRG